MRWRVDRRTVVTSTMDVAAALAVAGAPAGTVIVADEQTAGRGQHGRVWAAPAGTCLLFTAILRPPLRSIQSPDLARLVAERVAQAVREVTEITPRIKDPNDLMVTDRKLAGVLLQTSVRGQSLEYLLIGVGLNVNLTEAELPLPTATSLLVATGRRHDRDALLHAILRSLETLDDLLPAPVPENGPDAEA
ncbi:MAG TPA: biotin--[acetyl-CoA-carboxylase] ligase [Thermomicrobiaceae bacterium]|nr:biotin--[acetyl-CoA-carboxylase] ligase [Thermomicrobiaceae bacterium]